MYYVLLILVVDDELIRSKVLSWLECFFTGFLYNFQKLFLFCTQLFDLMHIILKSKLHSDGINDLFLWSCVLFLLIIECFKVGIHSSHVDLNLLAELVKLRDLFKLLLFLAFAFLDGNLHGLVQINLHIFKKSCGSRKTLVLRTFRKSKRIKLAQINVYFFANSRSGCHRREIHVPYVEWTVSLFFHISTNWLFNLVYFFEQKSFNIERILSFSLLYLGFLLFGDLQISFLDHFLQFRFNGFPDLFLIP